MASEKPETDGFLTVIEKKIAALKALADSYRAALSLGALGQPGEMDLSVIGSGIGRSDGPMDLPRGALLGKSLPAAVKLWLTAVRRKQTVREIATALREGGVESTSPNFENVVNGALYRLKATNEVLRFKDGWALAELYPATLRSSQIKDTKPAKAPRRAKKTTRRTAPKAQRKTAATPIRTVDARGIDKTAVLMKALTDNSSNGGTPNELYTAMRRVGADCSENYVFNILSRLRQQGKIEKRGERWYAIKPVAAA
jgi:hypothetical protein